MLEVLGAILAILYLIITPFIWRKLLTLLERVGLMSGIIASISSQFIPLLGVSHPTLKWGVFGGGLVILGITALSHYGKLPVLRSSSETNEFSPFKNKEKQDYYYQHLKDDIAMLNKIKAENKINLYTALIYTPSEKRVPIKAHFFTAEKNSKLYHGLFSEYQEAVHIHEELYRKGVQLSLIVSTLRSSLSSLKYKFDPKKEKVWVIPEALETAMHFYGGIEDFSGTADFPLLLKFVRTIPYNYSLTMQNDGTQEVIKLNDNAIAGAQSFEAGDKFYELIRTEIDKFKTICQEIVSTNDIYFSSQAYKIDEIIKNEIDDISNGIPIIGACKRCLECFTESNKKKWEKHLNKFYKENLDMRY